MPDPAPRLCEERRWIVYRRARLSRGKRTMAASPTLRSRGAGRRSNRDRDQPSREPTSPSSPPMPTTRRVGTRTSSPSSGRRRDHSQSEHALPLSHASSVVAWRTRTRSRRWCPGERLVISTREGPFPMETSYEWADTPEGGTHMTLRNHGEPSGFGKVSAPIMARACAGRTQGPEQAQAHSGVESRPAVGMGRAGIEPATFGLKVRCSTN